MLHLRPLRQDARHPRDDLDTKDPWRAAPFYARRDVLKVFARTSLVRHPSRLAVRYTKARRLEVGGRPPASAKEQP